MDVLISSTAGATPQVLRIETGFANGYLYRVLAELKSRGMIAQDQPGSPYQISEDAEGPAKRNPSSRCEYSIIGLMVH